MRAKVPVHRHPLGRLGRSLRVVPVAFVLFALPASADDVVSSDVVTPDFVTPKVSYSRADWPAAVAQLRSETLAQPGTAGALTFVRNYRFKPYDQRRRPALMQLNAIAAKVFPGIDQSPVPVLLPFDMPRFIADRMSGAADPAGGPYLSSFRSVDFFEAGPSGYSAVVTAAAGGHQDLPPRVFARPVEVHITASLLTYDLADPLLGKGDTVKSLAEQYPDIRRTIREGFVRYAFTRFGIPYVVSIPCLDSVKRARRLACREASPIAEHFLKNLKVVGGKPAPPRPPIASVPVERPQAMSPDFTYRPPGELIANSGYRGARGRADRTVYSQIRFPIEHAPAFANSQSFMNWGDCYLKGRLPRPHGKGDAYRCRLNDKRLVFDESATENYSYPWQDNFCETRDFQASQCPGGFGHQGQDIRPSNCTLRNEGADRCLPDRFGAVAVRDGVVLRTQKAQAMFIGVNSRTEHIRFRYMHMDPERLDADGMVHGRRVAEGERVGLVSNYQGFRGGTTTHLHFDIQVFTRDGWVWVNPYVTLIASYERLIGGRGREYVSLTPAADAPQQPATAPASQEGTETEN